MFCLKCGRSIDNVICDFCGKTNNETCLNNLLTSDAEMLKEILHHESIDKAELQTTHDEMVETSFEHRQIQTRSLKQESQKPVDESNAVKKDKTRNNIKKHILKYACTMIPILLVAAALGAGIGIISSKDDSGYILTEESSFEETSSESETATVTSQSAAADSESSSGTSTSSDASAGQSNTNSKVEEDLVTYIKDSIDNEKYKDTKENGVYNEIKEFDFVCDGEYDEEGECYKNGKLMEIESTYCYNAGYAYCLYLVSGNEEIAGIYNYKDKYIFIICNDDNGSYKHYMYDIKSKEDKEDGMIYTCSSNSGTPVNGYNNYTKVNTNDKDTETIVTTPSPDMTTTNGRFTSTGSPTGSTEPATENNNGNDGNSYIEVVVTPDNSNNQTSTGDSSGESDVETSDNEEKNNSAGG